MSLVALVANPASGSADEDALSEVRGVLGALGEVRLFGDASDDDLLGVAPDAEVVVAAGGDGTLNRVVNALADVLDRVILGLVPMGTGNELARTLELPAEPVAAARAIVDGAPRALDVGRARGAGVDRLFANACMGGFPVDVNEAIDEDAKRRLGPLAFWMGGAKAALDLTRHRVRMNEVEVADCLAVGVGNGRTCGGGMRVWPHASPDDGLLDACALGAPTNVVALQLAAKVRRGEHLEMESVSSARARRVRIEADPPVEFNIDGELLGLTTPATFEVASRLRLRAR